jgi:hypothetical protein
VTVVMSRNQHSPFSGTGIRSEDPLRYWVVYASSLKVVQ